jgi:ATP-binding cassette subfamily B (MDR/TAP) protein 1
LFNVDKANTRIGRCENYVSQVREQISLLDQDYLAPNRLFSNMSSKFGTISLSRNRMIESNVSQGFALPSDPNDGQPSRKFRRLDKVEEKSKRKASWHSLFLFTTRRDAITIIGALAATVLAGLVKPSLAIFFGEIFTAQTSFGAGTESARSTLNQISIWCLALTALGVAIFMFEGAMLAGWMAFGERQAKNVRQQMFTAMLNKDMEWYDLREDGMGSFLIRIQT